MKWAVAMDYWPDNPAGDAFGQALGRQQTVVQHMRALPHGATADALATVRAFQASVTTKRAFEFLVLTAARSGDCAPGDLGRHRLSGGADARRDHCGRRPPLSGCAPYRRARPRPPHEAYSFAPRPSPGNSTGTHAARLHQGEDPAAQWQGRAVPPHRQAGVRWRQSRQRRRIASAATRMRGCLWMGQHLGGVHACLTTAGAARRDEHPRAVEVVTQTHPSEKSSRAGMRP